MFKFHDDPTVSKSGSSFYLYRFGCMREIEKGKEKGKTKLRGRDSVEMYHKYKK